MNRKEINEQVAMLNFESLLLGYRELEEGDEELAFQVGRVPELDEEAIAGLEESQGYWYSIVSNPSGSDGWRTIAKQKLADVNRHLDKVRSQEWPCMGTAEGVEIIQYVETPRCGEPAKWTLESESDDGPEMYCSACLLERLGANGHLKVLSGEVTIDRQED